MNDTELLRQIAALSGEEDQLEAKIETLEEQRNKLQTQLSILRAERILRGWDFLFKSKGK